MIYPEYPKEGSVIGICAPSAGVGSKEEFFDMSLDVLHECGFETYETESVRNDDCPSAPAEMRGDEFNSLIADGDIDMIMSAAGGDYNIEMLPYIDQQLVRDNPKWFSGYSDPTAIEIYMTTVMDIATIYGVNAGAWDWRPLHKFQFDALSVISGELPVQQSYEMYCSTGFNEETGEYEMDTPVEWTLLRGGPSEDDCGYELHEEFELDVTGRLIGGCIDVIDWVAGTPYEDLAGFAERYKEDGLIWFFDNFELNPMNLMYALTKLRQMGLFDNAKAVVIGRTCFTGDADDMDYLEQLERVFGDLDVPLIWNADIGHTKPSFTIINGSVGHLTYDNGYAELSMSLE
ncbi:MAG: LD-carboxypeptidase [Mogibacterium sp.]|nr:LD-carboxypeptidase [Mogibacterium sp.]